MPETTPNTTPAQQPERAPYVSIAENLTFGVEIECTIPEGRTYSDDDNYIRIGEYHEGDEVDCLPSFNGEQWLAMQDGSIRPGSGRKGCEFVSPILKGTAGLQHLMEVVKKLREIGAKVNQSCGFHVHVNWTSDSVADMQKLTHLVAGYEKGLFACTGTKRREEGSFCVSVKRPGNDLKFIDPKQYATKDQLRHTSACDRYRMLNWANVIGGRRPTVEFRLWGATLNPAKMAAYVQLSIALVEVSLATPKLPRWDSAPAGKSFPGVCQAEREVTRLLARVGWAGKTFSWFGAVGLLNGRGTGLPTTASMVKILREMGQKYDGVLPPEGEERDDGRGVGRPFSRSSVTPVRASEAAQNIQNLSSHDDGDE